MYVWFGLVFESLAHEVDMHVCSFFSLSSNLYVRSVCVYNKATWMYQSLSVMQWCGKLVSCPVSTVSFKLVL